MPTSIEGVCNCGITSQCYDMQTYVDARTQQIIDNANRLAVHYCTVKNFGGEKILANLAKYQNSPSFFRQFIMHVQ